MATFEDKVVIVTGGAHGIGRATALEFAREGASVAVADVNEPAGKEVVAEIQKVGPGGLLVVADVASSDECRRVVARTVEAFGGVDVLFNNVGIQPAESYLNVEGTTEEMWDRIQGVNLKSYFLMSKYTIPEIRKRGGGAVVNTASVQGLQSMKGVPAYAASKGGVISLTRQMALDYAAENIRVNAVNPGTIDTEMVRSTMEGTPEEIEEQLRVAGSSHPIGRIGTGVDIPNMVLFLASDKAGFMTGENVCIDGGCMARGAWGVE